MARSNDRAAELAAIRAARLAVWELGRADAVEWAPTDTAAVKRAAAERARAIGRAAITPETLAVIHRTVSAVVGQYPGLDGHGHRCGQSCGCGRYGAAAVGRSGGGDVESQTIDRVALALGRMSPADRVAALARIGAYAHRAAVRVCRKLKTGRGTSPWRADAERQPGAPRFASWVSLDTVTGAALAATLRAPDRAEPVGLLPIGGPGRGPRHLMADAIAAGADRADAVALALALADARAIGSWGHDCGADSDHRAVKCEGRYRLVRGVVEWPFVAATLAAYGLAVTTETARAMAARAIDRAARADNLRAADARADARAARVAAVVMPALRASRRAVADARAADRAADRRAAVRAASVGAAVVGPSVDADADAEWTDRVREARAARAAERAATIAARAARGERANGDADAERAAMLADMVRPIADQTDADRADNLALALALAGLA